MYFTSLPNHNAPGFDEQLHFSRFKLHNIIFHAKASHSHCSHHVGCLSIKTVLSGEEWYGIGSRQTAVRPGQFLILNDDQEYSCKVDATDTRVVSVFFTKAFAATAFHNLRNSDENLLDNPFEHKNESPEFFQTLYGVVPSMQKKLHDLIASLEVHGYDVNLVNEHLFFFTERPASVS